ncbi:MAG TPA: hypothetical protein VHC49_03660 [Mycobacteriales bacterium]|nr:hypothetical protein [Mycobacteriales bacterium]
MSVHAAARELRRAGRPSLLDVAAETLVADPAASLATVAAAAGIGRTTLHKHYATRQDLLVAVAHRALDRALAAAAVADDTEDGALALRQLIDALVPVGAQLAFLFRQPSLDGEPEIERRMQELDAPIDAAIGKARAAEVLRTDRPEWWFGSTLFALVYVAWEGVALGRLAPLDATGLVFDTLVDGLGERT